MYKIYAYSQNWTNNRTQYIVFSTNYYNSLILWIIIIKIILDPLLYNSYVLLLNKKIILSLLNILSTLIYNIMF